MDFEASLMHDRGSTQSTPRWVMATGIMVIVLLLLFGSLHLFGRSLLGHALGGHGDDHAPPSSATEHGPQWP
jgi:hypothetical protein